MIVIPNLNIKVGANNDLPKLAMGKHDLQDYNVNDEKLVAFYNFLCLTIGGTLFKPRLCQKFSWVSIEQVLTYNQIDHFVLNNIFNSWGPLA